MKPAPAWHYDEYRQVGRDYAQATEVALYDESHARFRDPHAEHARIFADLRLDAAHTLLDIGAGTGAFAVAAARICRRVHAADVSKTMLQAARDRAAAAGLSNLVFHHAGFLTLDLEPGGIDAAASTFALHHLPDFWKGVALARLARILRDGGRFYLCDVVLDDEETEAKIHRFIETQARLGGDFLREDAVGHFRDEHSTYAWVMRGLLTRAGFAIEHESTEDGVVRRYRCRKARPPHASP